MKANIYKLKTLQVILKPYIKNGWKTYNIWWYWNCETRISSI